MFAVCICVGNFVFLDESGACICEGSTAQHSYVPAKRSLLITHIYLVLGKIGDNVAGEVGR